VITEKEKDLRNFRIQMSKLVSVIIEKGMRILGIEMPKRM
jgi:arginyl-tRNA synthetase